MSNRTIDDLKDEIAALRKEVADFKEREPLVLDLIERMKDFWGRGALDDLTTLAPKREALLKAFRKLVEFKP